MNRLVILGNGFDLSHGLKTGFTDFLKYLAKKRIDEPDYENDKLFNIINSTVTGKGKVLKSEKINFDQDFNQLWSEVKEIAWEYSGAVGGQFLGKVWAGANRPFRGSEDAIVYKSDFLKDIMVSSDIYDWVDFEKTYYRHLIKIYKQHSDRHDRLKSEVKRLNIEFSKIREEFLSYLNESVDVNRAFPLSGYSGLFNSEKISAKAYSSSRFKISKLLVLSFNYTKTLELYDFEPSSSEVIHIHGELNDEINPPIFGYGDEMEESYPDIESLDDNLFLEHFKSFQYTKTKNYDRLEGFLGSKEFEVSIVGHSCGLSDRVLLNHVFEHESCKSIKIYHHGGLEGHVNTYMNISRHFSRENKAMQRLKVVGFDPENACPQMATDS